MVCVAELSHNNYQEEMAYSGAEFVDSTSDSDFEDVRKHKTGRGTYMHRYYQE